MTATPTNAIPSAPRFVAPIFIGRGIRHSLRNVEAMIIAVVLPAMLMLLFTYVFGGAIDPGGGYVNYVVPGIILLCAGFGSAGTAVGVAEDMTNGIIDRFRAMPIRGSAVITGHVVASLARNLLATTVVFGAALLVGYRPQASLPAWLGVIGLISLYILAITWLAAALGWRCGAWRRRAASPSSSSSCPIFRAPSCRLRRCPASCGGSRTGSP